MNRHLLIIMMIGIFGQMGFSQNSNPFFQEWNTPFQVPPFEQIKNEHYMPAFTEAMAKQKKEIDEIIKNTSPPTFENTVVALDQSGSLLDKVSSVFYGLNAANTNPEMQEIAKQLSPMVTKHGDDIKLNPDLFAKISIVYKSKDKLGLDSAQLRLVEETYKDFIRGGANLDQKSQARLRELNTEINMLQLSFGQNLLAETNSFQLVVDKKEDLAGLPESLVLSASEAAGKIDSLKGKWVFSLQNPSVMPFLQYADNRKLRELIFNAYINRGNNNNANDNKKVIEKLVALRSEKARLMGFKNYASFVLEDRMAKTPENVFNLLEQLWTPALAKAREEATDLQVQMKQEAGEARLEGWDWRYYSEKVKKQRFALEEETLKPYFQLDNVQQGVFYVANRLYGITFTEIKNAPVYCNGVRLFECKDADGSHLGVLYLDFHPRKGKRGGAWCGSYRSQAFKDDQRVAPVMTIVCNFSAPTTDSPALLTSDETETLFHEFGHALHGLFKNVKYKGLSATPRDFVELPSQIMEHWAFEPEALKFYARHYKTGQVIPVELVEKIIQSDKYGQGFKTTEYLAACFLDMDYHILSKPGNLDVLKFEGDAMNKLGLLPQIPPRYRSTYFQHTMTGGYTAGYYSYIWAEVLDADAFEAFKETGDYFNSFVAMKFRKDILEKGGSRDAMQMYLDFRGRKPGIIPLLQNRGLN